MDIFTWETTIDHNYFTVVANVFFLLIRDRINPFQSVHVSKIELIDSLIIFQIIFSFLHIFENWKIIIPKSVTKPGAFISWRHNKFYYLIHFFNPYPTIPIHYFLDLNTLFPTPLIRDGYNYQVLVLFKSSIFDMCVCKKSIKNSRNAKSQAIILDKQ